MIVELKINDKIDRYNVVNALTNSGYIVAVVVKYDVSSTAAPDYIVQILNSTP
jgi:hypothetical protein